MLDLSRKMIWSGWRLWPVSGGVPVAESGGTAAKVTAAACGGWISPHPGGIPQRGRRVRTNPVLLPGDRVTSCDRFSTANPLIERNSGSRAANMGSRFPFQHEGRIQRRRRLLPPDVSGEVPFSSPAPSAARGAGFCFPEVRLHGCLGNPKHSGTGPRLRNRLETKDFDRISENRLAPASGFRSFHVRRLRCPAPQAATT